LKGHADRIRVDGISTFVVEDIETDVSSLSVEFELRVPEVKSRAEQLKVDGRLRDSSPVSGDGPSE
jgi:hypothetical protein